MGTMNASDPWATLQVRRAALVVAHPDDETLWAGGLILMRPECDWTVVTLCRGSDPDRAPRFRRALERLGAEGTMGDMDDGPEQAPLADAEVRDLVMELLPDMRYDIVLTHGPQSEYTRHLRHEETSRAVGRLWAAGRLRAGALWMFAYEDGGGRYLPRAAAGAHRAVELPEDVWKRKQSIITDVYGFAPDSFEARATPRREAFWCFDSAGEYGPWSEKGERR